MQAESFQRREKDEIRLETPTLLTRAAGIHQKHHRWWKTTNTHTHTLFGRVFGYTHIYSWIPGAHFGHFTQLRPDLETTLSTERQGGLLSCRIIITILVLHVCVFYYAQKNMHLIFTEWTQMFVVAAPPNQLPITNSTPLPTHMNTSAGEEKIFLSTLSLCDHNAITDLLN